MRVIRRYLEYLRNNPKQYWFKRRAYGWGWVPARKEGWAAILVFILLLLLPTPFANSLSLSEEQFAIAYSIYTLILSAILVLISYLKGEKPKWSWGLPKSEEKKEKSE